MPALVERQPADRNDKNNSPDDRQITAVLAVEDRAFWAHRPSPLQFSEHDGPSCRHATAVIFAPSIGE